MRSRSIGRTCARFAIALLFAGAAQAATVITQPATEQPGNVVRSNAVTLAVDPGGLNAFRSSATATYAYQGTSLVNACSGANSPLSQLIVKAPDGTEILNQSSPWKNVSLASVLNGTFDRPIEPQPTTTPSSGYRGGAWSASLSLAGRPAGVYTVTTIITNKIKTGLLGACTTATATAGTTTSTPGPVTESFTFEYRPWQQTFVDYFEMGSVQFNTQPREFAFDVDGTSSPIVKGAAGAAAMSFYALPDPGTVNAWNGLQLHVFTPPADPLLCVDEPNMCLPPTVVACDPDAGCVPRIAVITYDQPGTSQTHNQMIGFFDLQTRAFVAHARTGGKIRVLSSGGTDLDALLNDAWKNLVNTAAGAGIDLPHLLSQPVVLRLPGESEGEQLQTTVSLLDGIQLAYIPTVAGPLGPPTVGAGLIVHIGTWSGAPDKGGTSGYGLHVQSAEDLPALPALPSIGALLASGGKLRHIVGKVPAGGGQHLIALSVDTSAGEPNGLPVWLPLVSGATTVGDNGVEFIGDDLVTIQFDLCLLGSCSGLSTLVGTGVALFPASPLNGTVSIGELPLIWTTCTAGLGTTTCPAGSIKVIGDLDRLVADSTGSLLTNPAVQDALGLADPVLQQLLGPALSGIPGL